MCFNSVITVATNSRPLSNYSIFGGPKQLATQGIVKEEDLPIEILDTLFKHISMQSS
jgi:hypothetical protein